MIKAVIIDLDDTLCLTEAVCYQMENEVLADMGRPAFARELHTATWGRPLFEVITERSPGVDVAAFRVAYSTVIKRYAANGQLDTISDDNYAAIDQIIAQGMTPMILTSRTHEELEHLLEPDHLLAARVKTFYYRDTMKFHKPDPRAFAELLHDSGLLPRECLYVGDSLSDAVAAKSAGLHFVASLESGLRQRSDFDAVPVDAFILKFPDIVGAIQALKI